MIRLVVFDFDGTLFDTREDIADAVNFARRHFGLPELRIDDVTRMVGYGVQTLTSRAFANSGVDSAAALPVLMDYYTRYPSLKSRLYPGVTETLPQITALKAIVSNKPEELVTRMLEDHGLTPHFVRVAGGDTYPRKKPDPVALEVLGSDFGIAPREMVVVGDHSPDVEMARSAGAWSVFCRYGFFGVDPVGADFSIGSFPELTEIIGDLNRPA